MRRLRPRDLEQQRALAAALDRRQAAVPPMLLRRLPRRPDGRDSGRRPARGALTGPKGPWTLFLEAIAATFTGFGRFRQPIGALALVALGFFAARFTGSHAPTRPSPSPVRASPSDDVFATVRSVQPDSAGSVQIAFDETRRRVVTGSMEDQNIQRLLLAAAHEDNPAVRVESVDLLQPGRIHRSARRAAQCRGPRFQPRRPPEGARRPEAAGRRSRSPQDALSGAAERR